MIEKMPEELREIYRNNVFFHTVATKYEQLNGDYTDNFEEVYTQFMDKLHADDCDGCPDATGNREKRVKQWLYEMCVNFKA